MKGRVVWESSHENNGLGTKAIQYSRRRAVNRFLGWIKTQINSTLVTIESIERILS